MTRQFAITIIYISLLVLTLVLDKPYSYIILFFSTTLFLGFSVYKFWKSTNDNFDGQIIFRRQTKPVRPLSIFLAIIPTVGYFVNNRRTIIPIVVFGSIVLYDIIIAIMTKRYKPVAIIINDDKLIIINNLFKTSRNLSQLKSMTLNGLTDEIQISFINQKDTYLKRNEFNESDIKKLTDIFIKSTSQTLVLSDNLKL